MLPRRELHVWRIPLHGGDDIAMTRARELLSADEIARADRFVIDAPRRRLVLARAALRTILARYTGIDPRDLAFASGPHGKPHLNHSDLRFNLSHSEHIALLAVTRDTEVGIDIEHIDPRRTTEDIASRFFSSAEQTELANHPGEERRPAFFRCWSRKEAVIKALGEGLACPLDSFDVSLDPHRARLLALRREHADVTVWSMIAIDAHPDYAAAAALIGPCDQTAGYTFTPE